MSEQEQFTSIDEVGSSRKSQQRYWVDEITNSTKNLSEWRKKGRMINEKYLDKRNGTDRADSHFNIFWANTNIVAASLFARLPQPEVSRRFKNYDDDVARVASIILERGLFYELDTSKDFTHLAKNAIMDRLLVGMGQGWIRYEAEFEEAQEQDAIGELQLTDETEREPESALISESTPIDYVHWEDFFFSPCRTWSECTWVARRVYMTKDKLVDRFGKEKGESIPLTIIEKTQEERNTQQDEDAVPSSVFKQAAIYEIWDKVKKQVLWVCLEHDEVLDIKDDFLNLPDFFPCPEPMIATTSTGNYLPVPDYLMSQDLYIELNNINSRIAHLIEACKVAGVYDSSAEGIQRLLTEGSDNLLIPVKNWNGLSEKGGLKGTIDWLPLDQVITALRELTAAREGVKQQIYEITGLSDIVRGVSKATETLGAQQIKSNFASLRLTTLQEQVAGFFSELLGMKAHIMAKFYSPEKLLTIAGPLPKEDHQYVMPALQLLQDNVLANFRIKVTAESLAMPNWEQEKQSRVMLLQSLSQYIREATTAAREAPALQPLLLNILKFGVAGFRAGREIEGVIDNGLAALEAESKKPRQPSPAEQQQAAMAQTEMMKSQLELEKTRLEIARVQLQIAQIQSEGNTKMLKVQHDAQVKDRRMDLQEQIAQDKKDTDNKRIAVDHLKTIAKKDTDEQKLIVQEANDISAALEQKRKREEQNNANVFGGM